MNTDVIRQALEYYSKQEGGGEIATEALAALDAMQSVDLEKLKRTPPAEIISANDVGEDNYTNGWNDAIDRCIGLLGIPEGWQKIETAPRDGTHVLAYFPEYRGPIKEIDLEPRTIEAWCCDPTADWQDYDCTYEDWPPTHWMPLLPPPQGETR